MTNASIPSWDQYYLALADAVATRSKDPNTKFGTIIVGPNHEIRSTGYNSFPRGIRDDVPERLERPAKYKWIEHAERNAIYNAARAGTSTEGCTVYQQVLPCMDCARAIVQAGIREVVVNAKTYAEYKDNPKWKPDFEMVVELFREAGIILREA
jgi:dCMP deaminase